MNTSDILGIAGIIIGIVSSIYFYWISRKSKEPSWSIESNNLIQGYGTKIDDLEIYYKKQKIENLTISKLLFWNAGAETINQQDITIANPLRMIGLNNTEILDVKIISTNNIPSQFSCKQEEDKKTAYIQFDYMDKGNGAVFQITHTGVSSADILVKGTIKGSKDLTQKQIKTVWLPLPTPKSFDKRFHPTTRRWISGLLYFCLALASASVGIYQIIIMRDKDWTSSEYSLLAFAAILFVYNFLRAISRISGGTPRGLESFEQD